MNEFSKQPSEIIPISMNYYYLLNKTETITNLTVNVYDSDGADVTASIISNSYITDRVCNVTVKSGEDGERYKITIKASTDEGNLYEEDVHMQVTEL